MEDLHELTFAIANESEEVCDPPATLFMMCLLAESTSILDKEAHFSTGWLLVSSRLCISWVQQ
jgi:hypothetical protein